MRLNQFIAYKTGISRRQADELIKRGQVEVNGDIGELNMQVGETDMVRLYKKEKWESLSSGEGSKTNVILFYKPIFTVCSHKGEFGKKTIYDTLPKTYHKLKYAGRLDYMSEGLLILTDNGDMIDKFTHPKNDTQKEYLVGLKFALRGEDLKKIRHGIVLDDYKLNPVDASLYLAANSGNNNTPYNFLNLQPNFWWYKFILTEGRNNQIRRMCEDLGQKVLRLIRVRHGEYFLDKNLYDRKVIQISV